MKKTLDSPVGWPILAAAAFQSGSLLTTIKHAARGIYPRSSAANYFLKQF
jgi:hypothetical protein